MLNRQFSLLYNIPDVGTLRTRVINDAKRPPLGRELRAHRTFVRRTGLKVILGRQRSIDGTFSARDL